MFSYRNILKQSWQVIWHNKYLWFFGIFATLLGNVGEGKILSYILGENDRNILSTFNHISQTGIFSHQAFSNITTMMSQDPSSFFKVIIFFLLILVLSGFLIWLATVSQVAIVNNTVNIIKQKKHNFQEGINVGVKNFWCIFILNIIVNIVIVFILTIISLPFIFGKINIIIASLFYVILFIIFISIAISLSLIAKYAIACIIIKGYKLFDAIKFSWKLFKDNWIVSLEMAFILFFINFVAGLIIILLLLTLATPFILLAFIFYYFASSFGFWAVVMLAFLSALLFIVIGGSMLSTFQISSWTGLFLELIKNGGTPKIVRIFGNVIKK